MTRNQAVVVFGNYPNEKFKSGGIYRRESGAMYFAGVARTEIGAEESLYLFSLSDGNRWSDKPCNGKRVAEEGFERVCGTIQITTGEY